MNLKLYRAQRYSRPLVAINLREDDAVVDVHITDGKQQIFIATNASYGLTYSEDEVGVVGVRARGVKSINLREGDFVVSGQVFSSESKPDLLIATQRGAVKKMRVTEIETRQPSQSRYPYVKGAKTKPASHRWDETP